MQRETVFDDLAIVVILSFHLAGLQKETSIVRKSREFTLQIAHGIYVLRLYVYHVNIFLWSENIRLIYRLSMKRIGRPKKPDAKVGVFIRLEPQFAEAIRTAEERKGLKQGRYIETLITMGDQKIQKLTFKVRAVAPLNKRLLTA